MRTKSSQIIITFATQTKKQRPLRLWVQTNFDYRPIVLSDVFLLKKKDNQMVYFIYSLTTDLDVKLNIDFLIINKTS